MSTADVWWNPFFTGRRKNVAIVDVIRSLSLRFIGQEDLPLLLVRNKIGKKILGISVHNETECKEAEEGGADYVGVGPMYSTQTKKDTQEVIGPTMIRKIRSTGSRIPMVGIGGIKEDVIEKVLGEGADGVAVITSITKDPFPERAACRLLHRCCQEIHQ